MGLKEQLEALRDVHALIRKELLYEESQHEVKKRTTANVVAFPKVGQDFESCEYGESSDGLCTSLNEGFNYFRHLQDLFEGCSLPSN